MQAACTSLSSINHKNTQLVWGKTHTSPGKDDGESTKVSATENQEVPKGLEVGGWLYMEEAQKMILKGFN